MAETGRGVVSQIDKGIGVAIGNQGGDVIRTVSRPTGETDSGTTAMGELIRTTAQVWGEGHHPGVLMSMNLTLEWKELKKEWSNSSEMWRLPRPR